MITGSQVERSVQGCCCLVVLDACKLPEAQPTPLTPARLMLLLIPHELISCCADNAEAWTHPSPHATTAVGDRTGATCRTDQHSWLMMPQILLLD
jgi:hypothetical protein